MEPLGLVELAPGRKLRDPALAHRHPGWRRDLAALARRVAGRVKEASPRKDRCSPFAWPAACGDGRELEVFVCLLRDLEALELGDRDTEQLLAVAEALFSTDAFQVSCVTWRPLLATSLRCVLRRVFPSREEAARRFEDEMAEWWTVGRADAAYDAFLRQHATLLMSVSTQKPRREGSWTPLTGLSMQKPRGEGSWSFNSTRSSLFSVPEVGDDDEDTSDDCASI